MEDYGGLAVTKRGELRLLEPRIPGTGALYFCVPDHGGAAMASRRHEMANGPGNLYNSGGSDAVVAACAARQAPQK
jgi:hypothetical protein